VSRKKLIIIISLLFTISFTLFACAENTAEQSGSESESGVVTNSAGAVGDANTTADGVSYTSIQEVLENPGHFVENNLNITIAALVSGVESQFFYIEDESGTVELMIDYRGNQAMPQSGDEVVVEGQLVQNCCNPSLFMLRVTQFEIRK